MLGSITRSEPTHMTTMMTVVAQVSRGNDVIAFKRIQLPRPIAGDLVNVADLVWRVIEVRLISGKEHVGVQLEPASDEAKRAVGDVSGDILTRAGWGVLHPRAYGN
jgi:hypothetical protein